MEQFFNNIIIGFHFFPGRSFLGIYFGCHIAEEGGREESTGGLRHVLRSQQITLPLLCAMQTRRTQGKLMPCPSPELQPAEMGQHKLARLVITRLPAGHVPEHHKSL